MSTPVHAVATHLNTCRASRACHACRAVRVAPCCQTSATRLVASRHDFSQCQNVVPGTVVVRRRRRLLSSQTDTSC